MAQCPQLISLCIFIYCCGVQSLPNILFILIDDLGWNDLSYHGGCDYPTPNIDELAMNGLELNNYYIQHICSPTRSALMSGRYPIHTGLQDGVIRPTSPYGLPLDLTIIPGDLKRAGYQTHMIGKWHLGLFTPQYVPTARGFDTYFGYYLGAEDYYNHNRSYDGVEGYDLRNFTQPVMLNGDYSTYLYGNESLRILTEYDRSNQSKPFFLYLPFQAVHEPLQAPSYIIDSFNETIPNKSRAKKAAMVTVVDAVIGEIVDFLKNESKTNLWDNLMLIFSTDNGGPVNNAASNFPLRGSKATLWEGGVKGAGFVNGGWLPDDRRGKNMDALMHITDWYPTFCEMVGITPSNASILDGYSQFNNIMKGIQNGSIYSPRSEILHNIDPVNCNLTICGGLRMNEYKIVVGPEVIDIENICRSAWCPLNDTNETSTSVQCVKDGNGNNYEYPIVNETYIKNNCPYNGEVCLYNIVDDPCEWIDIKDKQPTIYQQMYNKLLQYNSTMVTPLNLIYPENSTAANPQNLGGFWGPWVNNSNFTNKLEL